MSVFKKSAGICRLRSQSIASNLPQSFGNPYFAAVTVDALLEETSNSARLFLANLVNVPKDRCLNL
jgi:hypothetical protein